MRLSTPLGIAFALVATTLLACESNEQILFSCGTGENDEGYSPARLIRNQNVSKHAANISLSAPHA